jgi:hypothetical protein
MLKYHFNISEDIKAVVQVQQLLVYIYMHVLYNTYFPYILF